MIKNHLVIFSSLIVLLTSCVKHQDETPEPPNPVLPFRPVPIAEHKNHPGHSLYMTTCYQCHMQTDPATLSVEKWKNTVPEMAAHAGITPKEGQQILEYILHIKSQGVR